MQIVKEILLSSMNLEPSNNYFRLKNMARDKKPFCFHCIIIGTIVKYLVNCSKKKKVCFTAPTTKGRTNILNS